MSRTLVLALVAALALVALAAPVVAKERAITTLDSLPGQLVAGTTYALGYTIRMDGTDPLKVDRTEIVARSSDGRSFSFAGMPDGAPGHYVARVTFPAAGTYQWSVTQGDYFAPMPLASITVVAAPISAPTSGPAPADDPLRTTLPIGIAGAAALLALRLARRRVTHLPHVA